AGREGHGPVERRGRTIRLAADPYRAQRFGQLAMGVAPGGDIDLASPGPEHGDGKMCRSPEAEQPDPLARLDPGDPKAAEADDPGAQRRRRVKVVERVRQRKDEVGPGGCKLGVASVYRISSERRGVAEVLHTAAAVRAGAVRAADPRDADPRAVAHDLADDLVAGNHGRAHRRQLAVHDV